MNEKETGGEISYNGWLCNGRRSIAHSRWVILDMYVCAFPLKHAIKPYFVSKPGVIWSKASRHAISQFARRQHDVISCGAFKVSQQAHLIGPQTSIAGFNQFVPSQGCFPVYLDNHNDHPWLHQQTVWGALKLILYYYTEFQF